MSEIVLKRPLRIYLDQKDFGRIADAVQDTSNSTDKDEASLRRLPGVVGSSNRQPRLQRS